MFAAATELSSTFEKRYLGLIGKWGSEIGGPRSECCHMFGEQSGNRVHMLGTEGKQSACVGNRVEQSAYVGEQS